MKASIYSHPLTKGKPQKRGYLLVSFVGESIPMEGELMCIDGVFFKVYRREWTVQTTPLTVVVNIHVHPVDIE